MGLFDRFKKTKSITNENGLNTIYDEDGKLKEEGHLESGKKQGLWNTYFDNGNIETERTYINGKENGKAKGWYKTGELKFEAYKKDVLPEGLVRNYHKNGQLSREGNYKDGKEEGLYKEYHENGQLSSEVNYKDGKEEGLYKEYSEYGFLLREINYKDGEIKGLNLSLDGYYSKEELLQAEKLVEKKKLICQVDIEDVTFTGSYDSKKRNGFYKGQVKAEIYEWYGKSGNKLSLDDIHYQIEIKEKLAAFNGIPNRPPIKEDYAKIVFYNHYCFIIKRHETKVFNLVKEPFSGRFVLDDGQAIRVTLGELNKEEGSFKDRDSIVSEVNEEFGVGSSAWNAESCKRKNEYLNVMKHRLQEQTLWVETIISSMTASKNESEEVVSPKVEWTELEVKALTEVLAKLATVEENMAGKPISKEKAADITLSNVPLEIQFLGRPLPVSPELGAQTCISVVSKMSEKKKKILNQLMVNITNIDENISRDEVWFMSQISPELFPMIKDLENIFPDGTFIYSIKIYDYETIETNRAIEGSLDLSALENTLLKYYQTLYDGFGGENTPAQLLERSNRMSKIKSWFKEKKPDAFSILFYDTEEEVDGQLQCETYQSLEHFLNLQGELKVNEILISSVGLVSGGDSHNDEEGYSGWMTTKSVSEVEEICKKHSVDINHQTHNLIVLHGFGETISVLGEIFPDKTFAWKRTWDLKLNDEQFETLYRQNQGELKEILIKYYKQVLDISEENINDFNLHRVWVSVQLHLIGPALDEILSNLSSTGIVKKHYSRENYTLEANGSHYLYYPRVYLNEGEFDFDGDDWDEQVSVVSKILGDFMDANGNREICQNSYFKEGVCVYEVKSEFDLEALLEPGW